MGASGSLVPADLATYAASAKLLSIDEVVAERGLSMLRCADIDTAIEAFALAQLSAAQERQAMIMNWSNIAGKQPERNYISIS